MDHPLSHTAAVVGGVAFVALAGCIALLLSDVTKLRSLNWWSVLVLSTAIISVCVIGYFRPRSRVINIPVALAGIVMLGICVWHFWWVRNPDTKIHPTDGLLRSAILFGMWLAWAGRTVWHLYNRRRTE